MTRTDGMLAGIISMLSDGLYVKTGLAILAIWLLGYSVLEMLKEIKSNK